ncbi:MAG: anaerobic ribonucleoside-triphosphate reductase activating protein [Candidatus Scalindua sp. AMX11]|nr:MAG: anaerobic ribonucleoside-triphosphate reductase activating protein [Candidatus Scalindua sp.]NOG83839.1 anaerobic ribonucleoside-triphosphate reductase activating protein [Planctomycetota bacterium]RZV82991.1 MAG: anaerobic ribonucleoside-triphosphate reductase activating protein [Candidatus Scalindua sp. SCAELEC01]TDE64494.1 MAG: anaerobic ribonucleoside-triphosphate reductase activating protein [Candidatus Scalindua sp. AMX11]GJQ58765.1 MAG: anaerobic ribonucleoside-triphosphate reduc
MTVKIKGFIENSLIEWPGNIVSIIFLPHCNMRCPYCHATHLVREPNELESIPVTSITKKIAQNRDWLDGVVITGGEVTLHHDVDLLISTFKELGLRVRIDTNGTNPHVIDDYIQRGLIDCVAMDIKAPLLEEKYRDVAGGFCNVRDIEKSIRLIMDSGIEYEFRTTVCPSFLDGADIVSIAQSIAGSSKYILQAFRPNNCLDDSMLNVVPYSEVEMAGFAKEAQKFVKNCFVRGEEMKVLSSNW